MLIEKLSSACVSVRRSALCVDITYIFVFQFFDTATFLTDGVYNGVQNSVISFAVCCQRVRYGVHFAVTDLKNGL